MSPAERLAADGVVVVDGFLPERACADVLDELHWAWWGRSAVVNRAADGAGIVTSTSPARVSETTTEWWFSPPLRRVVRDVEERLVAAFGLVADRLEEWQATRYGVGGAFHPHYDAGLWGAQPAGERTHTVLLYLDAPATGGGTAFPCLDLVVEPRPGRLLVWQNLRPDGRVDRLMRHASLPVEAGRKTVLITWGRERAVRTASEET